MGKKKKKNKKIIIIIIIKKSGKPVRVTFSPLHPTLNSKTDKLELIIFTVFISMLKLHI